MKTLCIILLSLFIFTHPIEAANKPEIKRIIHQVFGKYGHEAVRVAYCESRLDVNARNGQYLGLFQMGYWERKRFGHGSTALAQARAAYRYFLYSLRHNGDGWRPWTCRP